MNTPTSNPSASEIQLSPETDARGAGVEVRTLRRVIWAMTLILGLSLAANLALAYRIRKGNQPGTAAKFSALPAGTTVSPIKAQDVNGREVTISPQDSSQPVVIYVFTPQCIWCLRNLANLNKILAEKHEAYRFVGLSLTDKDLKQYLIDKKIDIPVFMNPAEQSRSQYRLGPTPQTIVLSSDGRVIQNWVGAYAGTQQAEVEKFFGVNLPGLTVD